MFYGAIAYADDVSLLCPSRHAVKYMLQIAKGFSDEYNVTFNHNKSNILVFENENDKNDNFKNIVFDKSTITHIERGKHLGNIIGKDSVIKNIETGIGDFYARVNMLLSNFPNVFPWIKYKLFKSFCMPLYGVQLWDLSSNRIQSFYVAWRKCIRRLLNLPYRTHCKLLNMVCNDLPVDMQIHKRFIKFFHSVITNPNKCIEMCGKLVMNGSQSITCHNLNYICALYSLRKDILPKSNVSRIIHSMANVYVSSQCFNSISKASLVSELMYMREYPHLTDFNLDEIKFMLEDVCTS